SVTSGEISAAAARFVSAKTAAEQQDISNLITARSNELAAIMNRVRGAGSTQAFAKVEAVAKRLDVNLAALEKIISEGSDLGPRAEAKLDPVHKGPTGISDKLAPIVDDSYFDVVTTAEDVGKSGDRMVKSLIDDGLQLMQAMIEIGAETNLVTGLLTTGAMTNSPAILALLEDRYIASARRAQKNLARLPAEPRYAQIRTNLDTPVGLANFKPAAAGGQGATSDRLNKIFRAHETLTNLLITLVDDLNFDLVLKSEDTIKRSSKLVKELVANQITGLRSALE